MCVCVCVLMDPSPVCVCVLMDPSPVFVCRWSYLLCVCARALQWGHSYPHRCVYVAAHIVQDVPLSDYDPADISMALCRMVSYNIGQLAYLNAIRYNIKRIFFGGFFIRGHPYTMETISYAIRFWSKVR